MTPDGRYKDRFTKGGLMALERRRVADLLLAGVDATGWKQAIAHLDHHRVSNSVTIDKRIRDDLTTVALSGRLDSMTASEVEQRLLARAMVASVNLVLDLSGLDYISSAELRVILMVAKQTKAAQGQFILCGMNQQIRMIFEISGFLTILRVVERCADALTSAASA